MCTAIFFIIILFPVSGGNIIISWQPLIIIIIIRQLTLIHPKFNELRMLVGVDEDEWGVS